MDDEDEMEVRRERASVGGSTSMCSRYAASTLSSPRSMKA